MEFLQLNKVSEIWDIIEIEGLVAPNPANPGNNANINQNNDNNDAGNNDNNAPGWSQCTSSKSTCSKPACS